jgi:hypothetical protein
MENGMFNHLRSDRQEQFPLSSPSLLYILVAILLSRCKSFLPIVLPFCSPFDCEIPSQAPLARDWSTNDRSTRIRNSAGSLNKEEFNSTGQSPFYIDVQRTRPSFFSFFIF